MQERGFIGKNIRSAITLRAVIIGFLLVILLSVAIPYNDYYIRSTRITGNHFPMGAVFILFLLAFCINTIVRRFNRAVALTPAELLVVWCMMIVCTGIPSMGLMRYFFAMLVGPFYYATPQNRWAESLHRYIPKWMVPTHDGVSPVVSHFFEGMPPDATIPWGEWKGPLIYWGIFIGMFYFMMFCLACILRKQWVERERLNFPLVQLPEEMVAEPEGKNLLNNFFKSRAMWIGFSIPVIIYFFNGMHRLYWSWPAFPTIIWLRRFLTQQPWRSMRIHSMRFYPSVIGFTYLLTLEVSFSFWFFYFFLQGEYVLGRVFNRPLGGDYSAFAIHQQAGAFLLLAVLLLWRARSHLKDVVMKAFRSSYPVDDSTEPMPYRLAFFGLVSSLVGMSIWCRFAGASLFFTFIALLLMAAVIIVLTRVVAQGGLIFICQNFQPYDVMTTVFGSAVIGPSTLSVMAIQNIIFIHDSREVMMPSIMNALRIGDGARMNKRALLTVMMLSVVVCLFVAGYYFLYLSYHHGASNLDRWGIRRIFLWRFNSLVWRIRRPGFTNWRNIRFMGYGALIMGVVYFMSSRFYWWPLHPLGILMANTYPMGCFWFSILLGWAIKAAIMKYGGARAYKNARPAFLGMILGEAVAGCFWALMGLRRGHALVHILP